MKDDKVLLEHILQAAEIIEGYVAGKTYADLVRTQILQDGLIRQFTVIGEAVSALSNELTEKHPDVPWRRIKNLRNVLVHEYFNVDLEVLWLAATGTLPRFKKRVSDIVVSISKG